MLAFVDGKYKGTGPFAKKLARRVTIGRHTPTSAISKIKDTVQGTPMYRRPNIEGDNVTVSKKHKSIGMYLRKK